MNIEHLPRIVAIEARRSRFGYAIFEGPNKLLDWGASAVPSHLTGRLAAAAVRKRVVSVLRRCHPESVVVKRPRVTRTGKTTTPGPIFRAVRREGAAMRMPIETLTRADIKEAFRPLGARTKDDIAEVIVGIFPELLPRLPHRRNNRWKPEWRGMIVFDAIAAGFAYWARDGERFAAPD
jgi:hypothetical protein